MDKIISILYFCLIITNFTPFIYGLEPFTTTAIGFGAVAFAGGFYSTWDTIKCPVVECCQSSFWVTHNVTMFEELFDANVFGQHIVKDIGESYIETD